MLRICSWCEIVMGWDLKIRGETHGICERCLQKYFPLEFALVVEPRTEAPSVSYSLPLFDEFACAS